jgi:hypothetical protein
MTNLETQTPFKDPDVNLELRSVDAHGQAGINLGLITNLNLHNNIDVRFVPAVSLQQRNFDLYLVMKNGKDSIAKRQLEAAYLELPFYVKFKSNYYRNMRVYYGQGIKYSLNLASGRVDQFSLWVCVQLQNYAPTGVTVTMILGLAG